MYVADENSTKFTEFKVSCKCCRFCIVQMFAGNKLYPIFLSVSSIVEISGYIDRCFMRLLNDHRHYFNSIFFQTI
uniref:SJCHGC09711 protein n=1 Tax=Schistosoma japonicum TaxID=6182 RepID=Q5BR28_SCHJA|nr:SJCHGC09711 protein [Schistosoma japonicum]